MSVDIVEWTYEPTSSEWGLMIFSIINFLINAASAVYLVYWRSYPPIKAKQLDLLLLGAAASWSWYLGSLSAQRVIPQRGIMLVCSLWLFWIETVLGSALWISCIILRMYRLYTILIQSGFKANIMKSPRWWLYSRLSIIIFPAFTLAILSSGLNANAPSPTLIATGEYRDLCYMQAWCLYFWFLLALFYLITAIVLTFQLRNIRKFLNEYRESKFTLACIIVGFASYLSILALNYHSKVWGRILSSAIILAMLNISYWSLIFKVLYGRLFKPQEFLDDFMASKDFGPNHISNSSKKSSKSTSIRSTGPGKSGSSAPASGVSQSKSETSQASEGDVEMQN